MRIQNKSMGSTTTTTAALELADKASVRTGDIEPLSSPLSTEALRIFDPPSFYQTGSKANRSSISFGASSSTQSEIDDILEYFLQKHYFFQRKSFVDYVFFNQINVYIQYDMLSTSFLLFHS